MNGRLNLPQSLDNSLPYVLYLPQLASTLASLRSRFYIQFCDMSRHDAVRPSTDILQLYSCTDTAVFEQRTVYLVLSVMILQYHTAN